jgi:hypothetical protein
MINVFWKKVCDNKGVTPSWEHKECKQQIAELERKIVNSKECIIELENQQEQQAKSIGLGNFVGLRTKSNIERHQANIAQLEEEKLVLDEKLKDMKLSFGERQ